VVVLPKLLHQRCALLQIHFAALVNAMNCNAFFAKSMPESHNGYGFTLQKFFSFV